MTDHPPLPALLRRLWNHLPGKRRFQLVAVFGSMLASGLAEIVSLAAVVPFLTVLADPGRLWSQPWVRGFVDLGAVAISWVILALFFSASQLRWNIGRWLAIGALLAVLFVFRRYWAFWVTSFAVVVTLDALWQAWQLRRDLGRAWLRPLAGPATIGAASAATAAIIAWPMIVRVLNTPYADIYSAYQMPAAGGFFAEIARSFDDLLASNGVLATLAGVAAVAGLVARRDTRRMGIVLGTMALISYVQFRRVQGAGHHHHLLWSSLLTAATAVFATDLAARLPARRAWAIVAGLALVGTLQWAAAAVPAATPLRFLVRGSSSKLPMVRTDLAALSEALRTHYPDRPYVYEYVPADRWPRRPRSPSLR